MEYKFKDMEENDGLLESEGGLYGDAGSINDVRIYPNAEVRVEKAQYSTIHLKRLFEERGELIIDPDFQRSHVWGNKQSAELIESILMGIPIPIIYLFETKEGKKQVVDGKQRITAVIDFLNDKLILRDLSILGDLNGLKFSELEPRLRGYFEDYQLLFYVIQPPTPERVKYDIFDRVNRGGTQLNRQEMRNALYRGKATWLLNELSKTNGFLSATGWGISDKRMRDKYVILRSISFYLLRQGRLSGIEYKSDMDDFLARVMIFINEKAGEDLLACIKIRFEKSMEMIFDKMGENAFRFDAKGNEGQTRRPINMPLFEVIAYLYMTASKERIAEITLAELNVFKLVCDQSDYFRGNVDSTAIVNQRFRLADKLINGEMYDQVDND